MASRRRGNVTVRVRGRWRRGRPLSSGQPLLMIEARGRRNRYPAMPEPPSARGAAPGTWQITFSIPASVARLPDARAWLQVGAGVLVALPVPGELTGSRSGSVEPGAGGEADSLVESAAAEEAAQSVEPAGVGEPAGVEEPNGFGTGSAELEATLSGLRRELEQLRDTAERERTARIAAEARTTTLETELDDHRSRSARAYDAITALRGQLEELRTEPPPGPPSQRMAPAGAINGASEAPARGEQHPARSGGRWLERALRQLARRSPSLAGRLLVVLVPGAEMEQERLVGLLTGGPLRRGRTRARGDSAAVEALKQRLADPGSLAELRLEPGLSLVLAAVMIDPQWTAGERFTIAYELPAGGPPGPYLAVDDGKPVTVSADAEGASVATVVSCPADLLIAVLAGRRGPDARITGEERPVELVEGWLERAQRE